MKKKRISITALEDASGAIDFEVDGVKARQSKIKLDKDSGEHELRFVLDDKTNKQVRFQSSDPIWAGENCPCPPPQGVNSDQLRVGECDDSQLVVTNANEGAPRDIRYQLNFISLAGPAECDPVITNGGGTKI